MLAKPEIEDITELRRLMDEHNRIKSKIDDLKESLKERLRNVGTVELPKELAPFKTLEVQTSSRSGFIVEATEFEILKWGKKRKPKPKKKK